MAAQAHYTEWAQPINAALLHLELAAALGQAFQGLTFDERRIGAVIEGEATPEMLQAALDVLHAHDPDARTPEQQQRDDDLAAGEQLRALIDTEIAWHEVNDVTAQNAVQVLARMQVGWVYLLRLIRAGRI
ncbi:MAG: hypothetical protein LC121_25545 [Anaerolineae bacterium]|nr:hypothetical protein [Anaerolineae bacterium]